MVNSGTSASEQWDKTESEDESVGYSDDESHGARNLHKKDEDTEGSSVSESLSDIKDSEIDCYINDDKQKNYKKIIWEMMNRKYLEDQAARKKRGASNVSNPRKKQKLKTAKDVKKAQSNVETAQTTSSKKKQSSRINHEALRNLFEEEPVADETTKRAQTESESPTGQADDLNDEDDDEYRTEEQNGWQDNLNYCHYDAQDEDYYYHDDDDLF